MRPFLSGKESTVLLPFRNCPYGAFRHQKSSVALSLTDLELKKQLEANKGKDLYGYQENAINTLMSRMDKFPDRATICCSSCQQEAERRSSSPNWRSVTF